MAQPQRALINKSTLKLIRETKQVSMEYLCRATGYDPTLLSCWEDANATAFPTISQAKNLAKYLKVPFAGLYISPDNIPLERLPKITNKRVIWGTTSLDDSALYLAIFDLMRLRRLVLDTRDELGESIPIVDYFGSLSDSRILANNLREYLGISYKMQKATSSLRKMFLLVRSKVEEKGILVAGFDDVELEMARGISLYFDTLPIIGVNSKDRSPAKTFSIIHELVHVLKRHSATCNQFDGVSKDAEEIFCNAVAGEFLVPLEFFRQESELQYGTITDDEIRILSLRYSVSREVIARRLLDLGYIQQWLYDEKIAQYVAERASPSIINPTTETQKSGYRRNMVRETFDRAGSCVCGALYNGFDQGIYSLLDVSNYLGVKEKHIPAIFEEVTRW